MTDLPDRSIEIVYNTKVILQLCYTAAIRGTPNKLIVILLHYYTLINRLKEDLALKNLSEKFCVICYYFDFFSLLLIDQDFKT